MGAKTEEEGSRLEPCRQRKPRDQRIDGEPRALPGDGSDQQADAGQLHHNRVDKILAVKDQHVVRLVQHLPQTPDHGQRPLEGRISEQAKQGDERHEQGQPGDQTGLPLLGQVRRVKAESTQEILFVAPTDDVGHQLHDDHHVDERTPQIYRGQSDHQEGDKDSEKGDDEAVCRIGDNHRCSATEPAHVNQSCHSLHLPPKCVARRRSKPVVCNALRIEARTH